MFGLSWVTKLTIIGVLLATFLGWFGYEKLKSYNAGKRTVIDRVNKQSDVVKEKWNEIDRKDITLDEAIKGLSK